MQFDIDSPTIVPCILISLGHALIRAFECMPTTESARPHSSRCCAYGVLYLGTTSDSCIETLQTVTSARAVVEGGGNPKHPFFCRNWPAVLVQCTVLVDALSFMEQCLICGLHAGFTEPLTYPRHVPRSINRSPNWYRVKRSRTGWDQRQ